MDDLQKIDQIRERTNVSYKEAQEALTATNGDIISALIYIEENTVEDFVDTEDVEDDIKEKSNKLMEQIKEILKKGNVNKVRIVKGDRVIVEFPANVGALGVGVGLWNPFLGILGVVGTAVALANKYSIEIERPDGKVETQEINLEDDDDENNKNEEGI